MSLLLGARRCIQQGSWLWIFGVHFWFGALLGSFGRVTECMYNCWRQEGPSGQSSLSRWSDYKFQSSLLPRSLSLLYSPGKYIYSSKAFFFFFLIWNPSVTLSVLNYILPPKSMVKPASFPLGMHHICCSVFRSILPSLYLSLLLFFPLFLPFLFTSSSHFL